MNAQVLTTSTSAAVGVRRDLVARLLGKAEHHLGVDEVLGAAERDEADLHKGDNPSVYAIRPAGELLTLFAPEGDGRSAVALSRCRRALPAASSRAPSSQEWANQRLLQRRATPSCARGLAGSTMASMTTGRSIVRPSRTAASSSPIVRTRRVQAPMRRGDGGEVDRAVIARRTARDRDSAARRGSGSGCCRCRRPS